MRHHTPLTKPLDAEVQNAMHRRYQSTWRLDDAFLRSQSAQPTNNNNPGCSVPSHHRPQSNIYVPATWWGLVFAYLAVLASLGFLFVSAIQGGFNLG